MVIVGLLLAAVLELTGLALAAVGFNRTWSEHARGEDFWAPAKGGVSAIGRRIERGVRWMIRRPRRAEVHAVSASINLQVGLGGTLSSSWGALPDPADGPAFAAKVHERLNELLLRVQEGQRAIGDERRVREDEDAQIRAELAELSALIDAKTARVAVGGLRLQVLGWSFILLGIVVGGFVNVMDALL